MSHELLQNRLYDYLAGNTSGSEQAEIEAHLEECAECQAALEHGKQLVQSFNLIKEKEISLDQGFSKEVLVEVKKLPQTKVNWRSKMVVATARFIGKFAHFLIIFAVTGLLFWFGIFCGYFFNYNFLGNSSKAIGAVQEGMLSIFVALAVATLLSYIARRKLARTKQSKNSTISARIGLILTRALSLPSLPLAFWALGVLAALVLSAATIFEVMPASIDFLLERLAVPLSLLVVLIGLVFLGRAERDKASMVAGLASIAFATFVVRGVTTTFFNDSNISTGPQFSEIGRAIAGGQPATLNQFHRQQPAYVHPQVLTSQHIQHNTEEYQLIRERGFISPLDTPLSTFSIDVDTAAYSNVRRFINRGHLPPKDAVRIEEFLNYFTYNYPQPTDEHPFSLTTEVSSAAWNQGNRLVRIGLKAKDIPVSELPPSNLVFLIDVSGSMAHPNKLPLLKRAFEVMVEQLREEDQIAIVVYAGAAGVVLDSTSGSDKQRIVSALNRLNAGGSTAGGAGIELAYSIAAKNFIEDGNNRVILATDGDFNIGMSSTSELTRMIEKKRDHGVYLTTLGFGMGNYKDSRLESLADHGNGNFAYIDSIKEARKALGSGLAGTLYTVAKDVKLQVEFNPQHVKSYRLIGYENRRLNKEDFNDDKKDAGEIGTGHTVTALYEIEPADGNPAERSVDPLKYQATVKSDDPSSELLTVKVRYKLPEAHRSTLFSKAVVDNDMAIEDSSDDFRFASAVAQFGMLLRDSKFKGEASYESVLELGRSSLGEDRGGHRTEFLGLVRQARSYSN